MTRTPTVTVVKSFEEDKEAIENDDDFKIDHLTKGIILINPDFENEKECKTKVTKNKVSDEQNIKVFDQTGTQMTGVMKTKVVKQHENEIFEFFEIADFESDDSLNLVEESLEL